MQVFFQNPNHFVSKVNFALCRLCASKLLAWEAVPKFILQSFGENGTVTESISSVTFAKTCSCISLSFSHSLFLSTSACYGMERLAVIPSAVVSGNIECLLTPCPGIFFGLRCCSNVVTEHFAPSELGLLCKGWYWFLNRQDKLGHEGECPPPFYSTFLPKTTFYTGGAIMLCVKHSYRWGMAGNNLLVALVCA